MRTEKPDTAETPVLQTERLRLRHLSEADAPFILGLLNDPDFLKLTRIVALTAPDNRASIRVLEKLGFQFDRMVPWTDPTRGSRLFVFER